MFYFLNGCTAVYYKVGQDSTYWGGGVTPGKACQRCHLIGLWDMMNLRGWRQKGSYKQTLQSEEII